MKPTPNGHGTEPCHCEEETHRSQSILLTGGPGAGKTAVLEGLKKSVCRHIALIPESASIVFGGGFWRRESIPGQKAAQRAIYHVQSEMERMVKEEAVAAAAICDRGTLDGLAYWPEDPESFFRELGTTREAEFARYALVIHLRTPPAGEGYNHVNPLRVETAAQAHAVDNRILKVWDGHSQRIIIDSTHQFLEKARRVIDIVDKALPHCCRRTAVR